MASRRATGAPSSFKNACTDAKSSKPGSIKTTKVSSSAPVKKPVKPSGTIVKSRYLQSAEKSSLSTSDSNESVAAPLKPSSSKTSGIKPKVGTPPRHSMTPQAFASSMVSHQTEPLLLGKSVLHSTFSHGPCFRPDFDVSAIQEKTVVEHASEGERTLEDQKKLIDMQTFLLAYLTAKMENNMAKFKAGAEASILQKMAQEEMLSNEVKQKKHQYLLAEKKRLVNDMLDLQIASLTPVAEAAETFANDYKSFATAVDTTRHELPVKNFFIDGDGREFLDKAETCLEESENLLVECTQGDHKDNSTSLECLKDVKRTSKDIRQQLSGAFSEVLELSSLACRHAIQVQQAMEEEQLGDARTRELYCPKQ